MIRNLWSGNGVRIICFLLAAMVVMVSLLLAPAVSAKVPLRTGDAPPQVSLEDLGGRSLRIPDDVRGKVVILHFWASGCSSCREEMPAMESLIARYGKRGLTILAINVGQRKDTVKAFVEGLKVSYPILLDPYKNMAREYGVADMPRTCILDRNGLIRYKIIGGASKESLNKLVHSLL
ncbi:MAG: TlpA family protein disulfide reductase [Verrucomicrobia bacterium]|nr:TlpA family protein disulfide reductase [Deltaproteobacteria bacterium]